MSATISGAALMAQILAVHNELQARFPPSEHIKRLWLTGNPAERYEMRQALCEVFGTFALDDLPVQEIDTRYVVGECMVRMFEVPDMALLPGMWCEMQDGSLCSIDWREASK